MESLGPVARKNSLPEKLDRSRGKISVGEVEDQLEKLLASKGFVKSHQLGRFLEFAVERALTGRADEVKEYVIAVEVFGRGSSYDPKADPIVRTEAFRLRSKLRDYYDSEGRDDPVVIELPKGGYIPVFRERQGSRFEPAIGERVLQYELVEQIGEGGMGVVYRAEDTRLKRIVALKFLTSQALRSKEKKARFVREAQAAAALDHPNICTVHEINEIDGQPFIVMAYLEGKTLKQMIADGPLSVGEAVGIASQLCQALKAAHRRKTVHRDIKPANIIVTEEGLAKVLDFGLARLRDGSDLTRDGDTVGTAAYMSPEQAQGHPIDHRTDLWSLGAVLQEMLSGRPPFRGTYDAALMYAVVHEAPEPLSGVPEEIAGAVGKALEKDPRDRFQKAGDFFEALGARGDATASAAGSTTRSATIEPPPETQAAPSWIAVLPFENRNRDEEGEIFSDGLTDELIHALTQLKSLRVIARSTVFRFKGAQSDIREIGRELKVDAVVHGAVRRADQRLRITAELISVEDGQQLWSKRFDQTMDDLFDLQDEVAQAVARELDAKLSSNEKSRIQKRQTENPDAYRAYLKGRYFHNHSAHPNMQRALECFREALREDPAYAPAYSGLAHVYYSLGFYGVEPPVEAWGKVRAAALKALQLDDSLAEAHVSLAAVFALQDWNWEAAEREITRALELNPGSADAYEGYARFYLAPVGRAEEALEAMKRAVELDPLAPRRVSTLAWAHYFVRDYEAALVAARKALELDPNHWEALWVRVVCFTLMGRFDEAFEAFEEGQRLAPEHPLLLAETALTHDAAGNPAEARKMLDRASSAAKQHLGTPPTFQAWAYAGMGEADAAFEWTEKACELRDPLIIYLKVGHYFDKVRSDPRYAAVVEKLNLA